MWRAMALVTLLSGCAAYDRQMACRDEVGPEPYQIGYAFGFVGALIMDAQPEHVEWKKRVNACVLEMKQAGR